MWCNGLTNEMITDGIMFLLKGGGWDGAIFHHRIIIDENVSRAFQWNSHHTKFISQRFNPFGSYFQRYEFGAKSKSLHSTLWFGIPDNGGFIQINQDTCMGTSSYFVPRMTCVHKNMNLYRHSFWLRGIQWDIFLDIFIEVCPIICREVFISPVYVLIIKNNVWMVMWL